MPVRSTWALNQSDWASNAATHKPVVRTKTRAAAIPSDYPPDGLPRARRGTVDRLACQKSSEIGGEIAGSCISVVRILFQALHHDRLQRSRKLLAATD